MSPPCECTDHIGSWELNYTVYNLYIHKEDNKKSSYVFNILLQGIVNLMHVHVCVKKKLIQTILSVVSFLPSTSCKGYIQGCNLREMVKKKVRIKRCNDGRLLVYKCTHLLE